MSRFLDFLVRHLLAHESSPSARQIAKEVFDKSDFHPRTDPIVRVEARRLRKMLQAYYEDEGAFDPIVIHLASRGYTPAFTLRGEPPLPPTSIAVLPFHNLTHDPAQEAFCEGVTEELVNALAQRDDVRVASRTSSLQFREPHDVRDIGRNLGVEAVLEGSVRQEEDKVRVTAQLTSADNGFHCWSQSFDGKLGEPLALQEKLAIRITDAVDRELERLRQ